MRCCRAALLLLLLGNCITLLAPVSLGQSLELGGKNDRRPTDIVADEGIEWRQNEQVYIARGNARATRGNATVYADTLIAHYRPTGQSAAAAPAKPANAPGKASGGDLGGSSEIWRVDAEGHVRLATATQTIYGDRAVYELDKGTAVVTGKHLRLVSPRVTVTARDSFEWYENKELAVARGDALAVRADGRRLAADVLVAQVVRPADGPARISRIDAQGHVVVSTANEIARGSSGVYNADSGIATLAGDVTITRGENQLRGRYAVVDLNKNVSRLLSALPGSVGERGAPVEALIVPRSNTGAPAAGGPAPPPGKAPAPKGQRPAP
jgi:lipopolysaccharide export system protein LptA